MPILDLSGLVSEIAALLAQQTRHTPGLRRRAQGPQLPRLALQVLAAGLVVPADRIADLDELLLRCRLSRALGLGRRRSLRATAAAGRDQRQEQSRHDDPSHRLKLARREATA